jgi:hypothetical protein
MSDFRAIGGVSATLRALLLDRMELPDGMAQPTITIGPPPPHKDGEPKQEKARLNLFLYRVTENGYLQNQEIPGRGSASGYGHPPLSLNLHYLLTPYGNTPLQNGDTPAFDETDAHLLLGSAMRVLHDVPIITPTLTTVRPPSGGLILHEGLRDEFEQIRLSLEPLTLEDITKVWTALAMRYRLSAGYLVNVVQIESRRPRIFPQPVGKPLNPTVPPLPSDPPSPGPWVYPLLIQPPTITNIEVRRAGETETQRFPYAAIGDTVVVTGTSLAGPETSVLIGDLMVPATLARPTRVEAVVPDTTLPDGSQIPLERQLQPGVKSVRVVARNPQAPQASFTSNEAVLMLVPSVDPSQLRYQAGPPRSLRIAGSRLIPMGAGGEAIIGRAPVARRSYLSESPGQIVVPIPSSLPARGVQLLVGDAIADPVQLGTTQVELNVTMGGTSAQVTRDVPKSLPRAQVAAILEAGIHDAAPSDGAAMVAFSEARVALAGDRLVVIAGDLTSAVSFDSQSQSALTGLGLAAAQSRPSASGYLSGQIELPISISSPVPQVRLAAGGVAPVLIPIAETMSLDALAGDVQRKIHGFSDAAYSNALVTTSRGQLLLVPGAEGPVTFDAVPGADDRTVAELQLQAGFAVRVRVNGAESVDPATVELPQ